MAKLCFRTDIMSTFPDTSQKKKGISKLADTSIMAVMHVGHNAILTVHIGHLHEDYNAICM